MKQSSVLRKIVILARDLEGEEFEDLSLDDLFTDGDSDVAEDASDSDGFLSEVFELYYEGNICYLILHWFSLLGFSAILMCFSYQDSNCAHITHSQNEIKIEGDIIFVGL